MSIDNILEPQLDDETNQSLFQRSHNSKRRKTRLCLCIQITTVVPDAFIKVYQGSVREKTRTYLNF